MRALALLLVLAVTPALAAVVARPVGWELGPTKYEGVLVYDDAVKTPRPGLLAVPNWMGVTSANLEQVEGLAGDRYVILLVDVYGKDARPKSSDEAGKLAGALKADRKTLRERVSKALEVLKAQAKTAPVDVTRLGAFGFCFGGTAVLELARGGAKVAGVVSVHGGLDSPTPADGKNISAKVLALHGADDPFVPAKDVEAFEAELRDAKVDWQLVKYGGAVHGFTDPRAAMPGKLQYDERATRRAYQALHAFFAEVFQRS